MSYLRLLSPRRKLKLLCLNLMLKVGFSFLFYQSFWDIHKLDFMRLVKDFEFGNLNLDRLNYAMITLIPKEPDATHLKKFRPISLINCSFKIFAKALNNRLIKVSDRLI